MPSSGSHSASIWSPRARDRISISARLPIRAFDRRSQKPRHSVLSSSRGAMTDLRSRCLNRDMFEGGLRCGRLGDRDGQYAVLECRLGAVEVESFGQENDALGGAVAPLAHDVTLLLCLTLGLLLAANVEHAVGDGNLHIGLAHPRQLGDHLDRFAGVAHVDPGIELTGIRAAQHRQIEPAPEIAEGVIDVRLQRPQRVGAAAPRGSTILRPDPRNEIADFHSRVLPQADLTTIFFAGADLLFGKVRRKTPSLKTASTPSSSTCSDSVNERS